MRPPPEKLAARQGSAMIETVLALPVVMLFAVIIIGFGVSLKRLSPLQNAARQNAWQQAAPGAPGPLAANLSAAFYPKDTPASLSCAADTSLPDSVDEPLKNALTDPDAQTLGLRVLQDFPRGIGTTASVRHTSNFPLFAAMGFTASVSRKAYRLNGDWRFTNGLRYLGQPWAAYLDANGNPGWHPQAAGNDPRLAQDIKDLFLPNLPGAATTTFGNTIPTGRSSLTDAIQAIYTDYPGYCGPNWLLNQGAFPTGQPVQGP